MIGNASEARTRKLETVAERRQQRDPPLRAGKDP